MQLTAIVFAISSLSWVSVAITDTATLSLPTSANCGDQAELICISNGCNTGFQFKKSGLTIYNFGGVTVNEQGKYFASVTSETQVQLNITNIQLSDVGNYTCSCGFGKFSAGHTLQYECKATTCRAEISSAKKLSITVDRLYPQPPDTSGIVTVLTSSTTQLPGTYRCVLSSTLASHFICTWVSTASLPDGNYSYTITITTGTQKAQLTRSSRIVTATSPSIFNLAPISNNRQVLRGVQDTPLTIQCVSRGGIPAPTLAWDRGNTSTSPLTNLSTNYSKQADGTYTVNMSYSFTPSRADDMTTFLCRVFYPGATAEASPDPESASALLYLDLKPDITTVSQTGDAISGGYMTLRCTSKNSRPAPTITWSYRDQTLTYTNESNLDSHETYTVVSVLQRQVIAVDNRQTATCTVSHTTLPVPLNATATVDVKFGPRPDIATISGNKTIQATEANQVLLNCTSGSSNPASKITWYNGSAVIPNTGVDTRWPGDNHGMITLNILTVTPTRYMDGDRITCRSDNGYGNGISYVDLDIFYSPQIKKLQNVTAIEGEPDVTLACSASSKPPSTFTWYKGNVDLASGIGTHTDNSFSYVIPRVDRANAGSYRCTAVNNVGHSDWKNAYLIVKYPPTVTVSATTSPPYTITCTAEGYPTNYTYQNWVQIWPGYGPVATILFTGTALTLTDVTYERSGVYVCAASNEVAVYGSGVEYMQGNTTILIKSPPVLMSPFLDGTRVLVAGRLGQNATTEIKYWSNVNDSVVRCYKLVARSRSPLSSCSFTESDTEIKLSVYNHTVTETGILATIKILVVNDTDLTDYDVVVSNSVQGESVIGITIVPQGPPSAPTITSNFSITPGQVILTVVPGFNGGYNQTLVVQISTDLTTWINRTSVNTGMDNRPIDVYLPNLQGRTYHNVRLFAYNIKGRSEDFSLVLNFTTAEDISTAHEESHASLIAGIVAGICIPLSIGVVVLIMCRWKKAGDKGSRANERRNLANDKGISDTVECAMYVSAGNVQPCNSDGDMYSKRKKKDQAMAAVYAVAIKHKKEPLKTATQVDESACEYAVARPSFRPSKPKQKNVNNDGLIYADLEFNNNPKKSVIHGLDDATTYVQVDFTKAADPMPDSDEETNPEK